nr:hypothetical protein TetV2_00086 [Oceanusvirus sp.]
MFSKLLFVITAVALSAVSAASSGDLFDRKFVAFSTAACEEDNVASFQGSHLSSCVEECEKMGCSVFVAQSTPDRSELLCKLYDRCTMKRGRNGDFLFHQIDE